jgi:hydroxypyruvate isomerase
MPGGDRPYRLAACAETLFVDRPFVERVQRINDLGYAVEFWSWRGKDLAALRALNVDWRGFTGHLSGSLVDPNQADEFIQGAMATLPVAAELGCRNLVLHMTEIGPDGRIIHPVLERSGRMWLAAYQTLSKLAELAERHGLTYGLENLNTAVDHPGAPLSRARDVIDLVAAVDSTHLRVLLDLYHAQVDEGNLIALLRRAAPWLGEVQVADVPGRHEPGTGEINYPAIAAELTAMNFQGVVGLEAFPKGNSEAALTAFSSAF